MAAVTSNDDTALSLGDGTRESSITSLKENLPNQQIAVDETEIIQKQHPTKAPEAHLSIRSFLEPPSDQLILSCCKKALKEKDSDQSLLQRSGTVSCGDVIAPAILHCMYEALGRMHSIIKRDHPDYSDRMTQIRKMFLKASQASCQTIRQGPSTAQSLRTERIIPVHPTEVARLQRNQNKHVWEEIADLMQAKVDLDREHKKWETVRDSLRAKLEVLAAEQANRSEETDAAMETETDEEVPLVVSEHDKIMEKIHDVVMWMRTSAARLVDGLPDATKLLEETEGRRVELYDSYKESQQLTKNDNLELLSQAFTTQVNDDDSMESL